MKKEALKEQSTKYLIKLEKWVLLKWKHKLELLNENTDDLYLIREVLKSRNSEPFELNNVETITDDVVQKVQGAI